MTTCYVLTIPVFTAAPPLNVEEVLKHVPGVKNWRKVGKQLLGYGISTTQVDVIERKYSSDSDRLQATVQLWLEGRSLTPSWRSLVWSLDHAGDITVADPIRGFAEQQLGESSPEVNR